MTMFRVNHSFFLLLLHDRSPKNHSFPSFSKQPNILNSNYVQYISQIHSSKMHLYVRESKKRVSTAQAMKLRIWIWRWVRVHWESWGVDEDPTVEFKLEVINGSDDEAVTDWTEGDLNWHCGNRMLNLLPETKFLAASCSELLTNNGDDGCNLCVLNICQLVQCVHICVKNGRLSPFSKFGAKGAE